MAGSLLALLLHLGKQEVNFAYEILNYFLGFLIPDFIKTQESYVDACIFDTDPGKVAICGVCFSNL